jgi:hypothetical protein
MRSRRICDTYIICKWLQHSSNDVNKQKCPQSDTYLNWGLYMIQLCVFMEMMRQMRGIAVWDVVIVVKDSFSKVAYTIHGGGTEKN